ncbi:hypothetical protein CEP54_001879 [Fusarium duplospermum]|uniref:Piwi domain-containing protein n=1 Tax=Fusarium duplospermum TaxID=1325734 RepID=A0A428QYC4_9HYPO|nr:hypothetical protein CEP54_001879 [Fusarium duplospermum]
MAAFEAAEVAETEDAAVETPAAFEVEEEESTEGAATLEDVATLEDEAITEVATEGLTVVEEEDEAVVVAAEEDSVINHLSSRIMGGVVPQPDPATTKLENETVQQQSSSTQQLISKMGKLELGGKKSQEEDKFPARPAFGTRGNPVTLWANYYGIKTKFPFLYKYTITVKEIVAEEEGAAAKSKGKGKQPKQPKQPKPREVKGRKLHLVISEVLKQLTSNDKSLVIATEFKSQLVSLKKLPLENDNTLRVSVATAEGADRMDVFEVEIHGPNEIRMNDLFEYLNSTTGGTSAKRLGAPGDDQDPAIALDFPKFPDVVDCLNVIFGYGPRSNVNDISAVGRSRFFSFKNGGITTDLGRSLIAARGFFQSVRLGTGRLLLNANVTHGIFKVAGKCDEIFRNLNVYAASRSDARGKKTVNMIGKFLPKTRVWVTMMVADGKTVRRSKAIFGIVKASHARSFSGPNAPRIDGDWEYPGPKNVSFYLDNRYITVFDYYRSKYNFQPQNYPLLNLGTASKPTFVPAEFVEIQPGQAVKAKLNSRESTEMVNFACRSPYANAFSITGEGRETLGLDGEVLEKFGIAVDKTLLTVQGRVLPAPAVAYLDSKRKETEIRPFGASWNMKNIKVYKSGRPIQRWAFVNLAPFGDHNVVPISKAEEFAAFMNTMDIRIANKPIPAPTLVISAAGFERGSANEFFKWAKGQNIEFILVALGSTDTAMYSAVKLLGDVTYGIHTSCVQGTKLKNANPGYYANVALKWNLKAGGVNHKLRHEFGIIKEGKTMVVGYDVTHPTNLPTGASDDLPSLVGLVATIDRDMGQWPAISWEQSSKQEMLDEVLTEAFKSRLQLWKKHNKNQLPENIVIFRDGVSEGQFAQVLQKELPRMRIACNSMYPKNQQPKLTIVVSVKRHQTRFYPTTEENLPKERNIQNGTVVDRGVTQARYWDFFLTAHTSIKGTARPAHYTVLLDEIFRAKHKGEAANELEKFTHELCYLYGRATKAVSICPPAYYADIVCTRARAYRPELADFSDTDSVVTGGAGSSVGGSKQVHEALKDSMYYI